ncbi:hypothetical protein, partial [Nocardia pseudovaccinii]|uniref:hypothetical protein n=1 Tax=Nocardia pseudovaccinii TaxID=189540 RepID=UPI001C3F5547
MSRNAYHVSSGPWWLDSAARPHRIRHALRKRLAYADGFTRYMPSFSDRVCPIGHSLPPKSGTALAREEMAGPQSVEIELRCAKLGPPQLTILTLGGLSMKNSVAPLEIPEPLVITLGNLKGGVGKTTSAFFL